MPIPKMNYFIVFLSLSLLPPLIENVFAEDLPCGMLRRGTTTGFASGGGPDAVDAFAFCVLNATAAANLHINDHLGNITCKDTKCPAGETCSAFAYIYQITVVPAAAVIRDNKGNIIGYDQDFTPQDIAGSYDKKAKESSCYYHASFHEGCTECCVHEDTK